MRRPRPRSPTDIAPMLLICCPYCGTRPELEFTHAGQAHLLRAREPSTVDAQEWADFLYMRDNTCGVHAERWRHTHGCGRFFNALRDTSNDQFLATYRVGVAPPATALEPAAGPDRKST